MIVPLDSTHETLDSLCARCVLLVTTRLARTVGLLVKPVSLALSQVQLVLPRVCHALQGVGPTRQDPLHAR